MRPPSILIVPVIFVGLLLAVVLPKLIRAREGSSELLPTTSLGLTNSPVSLQNGPSISVRPVFPGLGEFAGVVANGDPKQIVGVYIENQFSLPVIQQPDRQPAYVSEQDGLVTQFRLPSEYGTVGLLAHNYLSGRLFELIQLDDEAVLLHGDGQGDVYRVIRIERYQAIDSTNPYSQFIDLTDLSGKQLSSGSLFKQIYTSPNQLVFQTCIAAYGDSSWGRLFITAKKVSSLPILLPVEYTSGKN
jgi:hypothetical protein